MILVLMSVYNESKEYIEQSIESILNQTYQDYHLTIVNDNPIKSETKMALSRYSDNDKITIINNEQNLGLAMSMNKAYKIMTENNDKFTYLARMDSDDISIKNRFELQINMLERENADFCYTNYNLIDSKSQYIGNNSEFFDANNIENILPYRSCIHHPTVMMKINIFEESGGYRNFPCAQDYDLWLRILEMNIKFTSLSTPLLDYRIRDESISRKSSMKQEATIYYSRTLRKERLKTGSDSFSEENYSSFLEKFGVLDSKKQSIYDDAKILQKKSYESLKEKKRIISVYLFVKSLAKSRLLRVKFIDGFKFRLAKRKSR